MSKQYNEPSIWTKSIRYLSGSLTVLVDFARHFY